MTQKKLRVAEVIENIPINPLYFKIILRLNEINSIKPGQFINLKLDNIQQTFKNKPIFEYSEFTDLQIKKPFLMRPFSVGRIIEREGEDLTAEFLIKEIGIGSHLIHNVSKGTVLNYLGPLGNHFKIKEGIKTAILIAGGTGLAPLMALSDSLVERNIKTYLIAGGTDKDNLPVDVIKNTGSLSDLVPKSNCIIPDVESKWVHTGISTDDGSLGYKGFVTDLAENLLNIMDTENLKESCLYSCGPINMMKAAHKLAEKHGTDHQVSLERHMACGLGVCLSCVNRIRKDNEWEHVSICNEGPVFEADKVIFHD